MIEFRNVSVRYRGEDLFGNLNLKIEKNSKNLIVGKSGYGKSTLFSILLGFYSSYSGEIFFENKKIDADYFWRIRKKISFVDQETSLQFNYIHQWFDFVGSLKVNRNKDFTKETILFWFDFFELNKNIYNEQIVNISGGEKQRIAIITAILLDRNIYFLDEPTSALDGSLKKKVIEFFSTLNNKTVIVVSHDEIWREAKSFKVFDMEAKKWVR